MKNWIDLIIVFAHSNLKGYSVVFLIDILIERNKSIRMLQSLIVKSLSALLILCTFYLSANLILSGRMARKNERVTNKSMKSGLFQIQPEFISTNKIKRTNGEFKLVAFWDRGSKWHCLDVSSNETAGSGPI